MKSSIMRGNFGLFCSFSQKLPRIHVGLDCNANEKTLTVKRAILYSLLYSLLLLIRDVWSGAASINGGSCLPDKGKQTYSCSCVLPWTGDRCEINLGNYGMTVIKPN